MQAEERRGTAMECSPHPVTTAHLQRLASDTAHSRGTHSATCLLKVEARGGDTSSWARFHGQRRELLVNSGALA